MSRRVNFGDIGIHVVLKTTSLEDFTKAVIQKRMRSSPRTKLPLPSNIRGKGMRAKELRAMRGGKKTRARWYPGSK